MRTYHRDTGLPAFTIPYRLTLEWESHALDRFDEKCAGLVRPDRLLVDTANVFEVTMEAGRVVKFGTRHPILDSPHDLVLFVGLPPDRPGVGLVRTVYLNHWFDCHRTLNKEKYAQVQHQG